MKNRIKYFMVLPYKERMKQLGEIRLTEKDVFQEVMLLTKVKMKEERKENIKIYWNDLDMKIVDVYQVPDLPRPLEKYQIEKLIECGCIAKKDLIIGEHYLGKCRNADTAVWTGVEFEYQRNKFGRIYPEIINHFEDDNGFDLFVPIRKIDG